MNKTARRFEALLSRYFETLLKDNPAVATISAGLRSGEGKLGQLTLTFHKKREREPWALWKPFHLVNFRTSNSSTGWRSAVNCSGNARISPVAGMSLNPPRPISCSTVSCMN